MRRPLLIAAFVLFAGFVLTRAVVYWIGVEQQEGGSGALELALPELSDADYDWIGSRIYQNEALGKPEYLTHWNEGEDFPSLGIGHFIWFPKGVDAPFDEQFPALVSHLRQQVPEEMQMPAWLQELDPFVAPWDSKAQFDGGWSSAQMSALRQWLEATQLYQAKFIVSAFEQRWRSLELPPGIKQELSGLLQSLFETPEGLFSVIDYYNFKGLGNNPRESYQEQGWGLVQVLDALTALRVDDDECPDMVSQFREAAAGRLRLRVELSTPERNEARWLAGWLKRLDGYLETDTSEAGLGPCGFHVTPYLQNPAKDAMTLIWFSKENRAGQLTVWKHDSAPEEGVVFESGPVRAGALAYHPAERCEVADCSTLPLPYLHQIRLQDLEPDSLYRYRVTQDTEHVDGSFTTPDDGEKPLRFIVYGDSETEPESSGKHTFWPSAERPDRVRRYPLDQTTGYAQNLKVIQQRQPAFVAIAGDLVQSGGEQRDWDEFWSHNAQLAASTVLLPSLGNHDYFGGPGELGKYATPDSEGAVRKYQTYFDLPSNNASDGTHSERYYSLQYGAVTLIVLDVINGLEDRSDMDTNWRLLGEGEGGFAPDWQPGSKQYDWLLAELKKAQENDRFTFVMFHHSPYTSGVHGRPPGEKRAGGDILSAQPLQTLTPLFIRHGVDAVFGGHDEMYEHSLVPGTEVSSDGVERAHDIHFYDIGIGGDGLRGPVTDVTNPYRVFLAHSDATEVYGEDGVLRDGGKHYGHLEVNVEQNADGIWQARMDPVYVFPVLAADGRVVGFERRVYADMVTLTAH